MQCKIFREKSNLYDIVNNINDMLIKLMTLWGQSLKILV